MTLAAKPTRGEVFWTRDVLMPSGTTGSLPTAADAVVIGGGLTGLAAARKLAAAGRDVVLVEREQFGSGASARSAGFAHAGVRRSAAYLKSKYGERLGGELYAETVRALAFVRDLIADEPIDCNYTERGYLYLVDHARQVSKLRASQAILDAAGHTTRLLSREQVAEQSGSRRYAAGLLLDGAASVQPAEFVAGLAASALRSGAKLYPETTALELVPDSSGVVVKTSRGTVTAGAAMIATDGYTGSLNAWLQRRVIPIESFVLATKPLSPQTLARISPHGNMCIERKNFLCYWRTTADGRLIFGGRASLSQTSMDRASTHLLGRIRAIYPGSDDIEPETVWSGATGFSIDQLPHLGCHDNIYYATTYCGGGVALAPWLGQRAAEWMLGGAPTPYATIPFPRVPLFRGNPWFLPLAGRGLALQDRFAL